MRLSLYLMAGSSLTFAACVGDPDASAVDSAAGGAGGGAPGASATDDDFGGDPAAQDEVGEGMGGEGSRAPEGSDTNEPTAETGGPPPGTIPVIVGVGWRGVRVLSIDEGETFCVTGSLSDGHDDLFRGGGYHDGLFLGGHAGLQGKQGAIFESKNGYDWSAQHRHDAEPDLKPGPTGQWFAGAAFGNGVWLAAGGLGNLARSTDGRSWEKLPSIGDGSHVRSIVFFDGEFVAANDKDLWFASTDGDEWNEIGSGDPYIYVLGDELSTTAKFQDRGVCVWNSGWADSSKIMRSETDDCSGGVEAGGEAPGAKIEEFMFGHAPASDFEGGKVPADLASCLGL